MKKVVKRSMTNTSPRKGAVVKRSVRKTSCGSSPIKRNRRTKADIAKLYDEIYAIVDQYKPMTVRQVFYQCVSRGLIEKSESEYKSTITRLLGDLRRHGVMPFDWIADNTRWQRKPRTYSSLPDMLELTAQTYRRAVWGNQQDYVEIWLEKEALAGVLFDVTHDWDVPLYVSRGYPSLSYMHSAAEFLREVGKPAYLYYFGDFDPSGVDISRFVEDQLREYASDVDLHFERVAVNEWQIDAWDLPTRPTKTTDSRSKGFGNRSVEVDAIQPDDLRELCADCITRHIDQTAYQQLLTIEEAERVTLSQLAGTLN